MDRWLNVAVKGSASWPTEETTVVFQGKRLILKPATHDTEQSVHINLRGINGAEALTLINRFLSVLSWCDDQPMENRYGWSGNPIPVAVPRELRVVGASNTFPFCRLVEPDKKARLALALFREGRTVNSIPFEFLSYFKILNIFWKDRWETIADHRQNPMIEGIRATLPHLRGVIAVNRVCALGNTQLDVPKYLYESGRCAVAHAYADPIVDPDDVCDLRRLSEDMSIVKEVAEFLIETELGVSRSIIG
jgi:hypothetical protein